MRDCVGTTTGVELLRIMLEVDWMLGTATPKEKKGHNGGKIQYTLTQKCYCNKMRWTHNHISSEGIISRSWV